MRRKVAESRSAAVAMINDGAITVRGIPTPKPASMVDSATPIEMVGPGPKHVSRGGLKLEGALDAFGIDVTERVALDAGASTGGFTDHLLQNGVSRVSAVDVGHAQLHERIVSDSRVEVHDRTNIRLVGEAELGRFDLIVADLSFISLCTVAEAFARLAEKGADLVLLVKPQFEAGKEQVGRGGIVKNPDVHRSVLRRVIACLGASDLGVQGVCDSPIRGAKGNREFFVHAVAGSIGRDDLELPDLGEELE